MNGEWPEQPSLRFLIHWALREELCDPDLCPDAPEAGGRCDHCPLDRLDAAANSEPGLLLQRAVEMEYALKAGVTVSLEEIGADEFWAMRVIKEERECREREAGAR